MTTYTVYVRSQHAKRGNGRFHGPDTYVAVTACPDGANVPRALNRDVLAKRGIRLWYFGVGYAQRQTSGRSMLSRAIASAREYADCQNRVELAWANRAETEMY